MESIGKNEELIERLQGKLTIISAGIYRFEIFEENDILVIAAYMKLAYRRGFSLKLKFSGVKEYGFYYKSTSFFYNIVFAKLF